MDHHEDLLSFIKEFASVNKTFENVLKIFEKRKLKAEEKCDSLLNYIALELMVRPTCFDEIIKYFSREMPLLLYKIILTKDNGKYYHIAYSVIFGKVVMKRPDLQGYALRYFKTHPSPFEEIFDMEVSKKRKVQSIMVVDDLDIVESCYYLLKSNPDFYRNKWNWSAFMKNYLDHSNVRVKWLCCYTISVLFGMSEYQLRKLTSSKVSQKVDRELACVFHLNSTLITSNVVNEDQFPENIASPKKDDQCVNISGIYIPVEAKTETLSLVEVPSTVENLRKLAEGLSSNKGICLQGVVGSGKTSLVEYLASKTGRKLGEEFLKIQLGDQTDSKMLLGTYRCTDIPGEFVWQPGVLTQAVLRGSWLLLEDIDSASMDIASVLTSLLENRYLTVPGYRDTVPVTPGFQLFVTQRLISTKSGHHKKHSNAITLMEKQILRINIDPLNTNELKTILETRFVEFKTITDRMINVFLLFTLSVKDGTISVPKSGRLISTRDFFKWCTRAVVDFDVKSQDSALKVLQDAIDVFCCSFSNSEESLSLAKQISTHLGIINQKAEYFFKSYKPNMTLTADNLVAGRVALKRQNNEYSKKTKYSFTRLSAVLIERIMCCISLREPVLLVGETGTGKTSSIQFLANTLGKKLVVINMNQQSDSVDLLGGFKPVDLKYVIGPVRRDFERIFCDFFQVEPNKKYLGHIAQCFNNQRWLDLVKLMSMSYQAAVNRLTKSINDFETLKSPNQDKYKKDKEFLTQWRRIGEKLHKLELQLKQKSSLAFAFIEGSLVKAVENGYWVLLDEINLANAETLECLSGLLEGTRGSLCLLERGDMQPIKRHSDFTLFACMNPSTDVGKKDLPSGLRNRFTEFFVDELNEKSDLLLLVNSYLEAMCLKPNELENIVNFYLNIRKEMMTSLSDGLGHKPHFSLRSLCRALVIASKNPCGTFKRSLYESFCLSFLTQLDSISYKTVEKMIVSYMLGDQKITKAIMNKQIPEPQSKTEKYLQFEGYWVKTGFLEPHSPPDYILTESVRRNLKDLVRVVSIGKLPVLLQGDTSVGKTSLITYLAKSSGNKCVRINNHEHTDLQEYIGSYVADMDGKLVFREGLLVEAMRKGHWIILDELNLAPTDVLEALNRVLDDNRELYIPETQETVKADSNFMLFATQNPPGVYGGRKMLSRAFRNRFVELHFNEIPPKELEAILHQRCQMAPSYAKKMINVMTDLQMRRRGSAAFAGKQGFMTLRDLFRWGERYRLADNVDRLYDWDQHLADEGYLVLAGKVRKIEEKHEIAGVLQKHLKREVVPENLFTLSESTSTVTRTILEKIRDNEPKHSTIVWTYNMRQLAVLTTKAMHFNEPVLLVGETGGGKTTMCKLIAESNGQQLITVNCHMHTESSDFIGGLRPVRDHSSEDTVKLFEWIDGPLIQAMQQGHVFLADEISLADDSVLERLNSLLEPERTLLLAEKGIDLNNSGNSELIVANPKFHFIGTMNPGGDFGKKELSPALRNRFTEIWCVPCESREDLIAIVEKNIKPGLHMGKPQAVSSGIGDNIIDFVQWFQKTNIGRKFTVSIRDILTWVNFMNKCSDNINVTEAYIQGAFLTFIDSLGSGITSTESRNAVLDFCMKCNDFFLGQLKTRPLIQRTSTDIRVKTMNNKFGIEPFFIESHNCQDLESSFIFNAPTTASNTLMLLRGMQLNKPILLEGSPGVGKTSLVSAVAKATGHELFRVNLSDQTDISDLFGADLPVEGGIGGQFSWRDGPLLQALKRGSWILLDELNLASQSVLEGLNACLDHRGEIYIPELGKTFYVKTGTKFFGCQNPLKQGGSRRGLPRSFLNRFTQVYINALRDKDLHHILTNSFKNIPSDIISDMIKFNNAVAVAVENHIFGQKGSPWECNLRDLTRWCEAMIYHRDSNSTSDLDDANSTMINDGYNPDSVVDLIYGDRMRTSVDKKYVREQFESAFGREIRVNHPVLYVNSESVHIGDVRIDRRHKGVNMHVLKQDSECLVLRSQLDALRSLAYCVNLNWMAILVGDSGSGKSSVVKTLANLAGKTLKTLPVTSAMDTADLLGGFEQTDYTRHLDEIARETEITSFGVIQDLLTQGRDDEAIQVLAYWEAYRTANESTKSSMDEELKLFQRRCGKLNTTLQILKSLSNHSGIPEELETKLNIVTESVAREKSLNAGGKFEWVDSLLIKCLRDGSWLLIDNVNLCSSAVLDRLNALLEPNGTLTIFERGINENGTVVEIQPHEDFRLFLTMDPKNGEISRAMRNRGIEIYMLNETESDKINEFDVMSLVYSEGIENPNIIKGVIKFHQFVCEILPGEKPSINDMLQTASLLSKQLRHSCQSLSEKFLDAVMEVYYKTRSPFDFNCVDAISTIKNKVSEILSNLSDPNGNNLFENRLTLSTKKIESCSVFEKIRQQAVYLEHHMHIDSESVRVSNISINYLVAFYSIFSPEDLEFRHLYLNNQLSNKSLEESCYAIASKYKNECQNLPYDPNWISGAIYKVRPDNYHNLNLALYIRCHYSNENTTQSDKSKKVMTVLKYMHKIKENKLEDMFNDMVISNFLDIIKYFDEYTCEIIASNINLSAADVISFINFFQWRLIFLECTSVSVKQTTAVQRYAISTNLRVHYKWFYKHSVEGIRKIANTKLPLTLETLLETVNNSLTTEFSAINKVGKRYQKVSNRPPPFINEHQLSTVPLFNCINALYNIVDRSSDPIKILNIFIQERQLRPLLIQMKSKMSYEFDDLSKEITLLESLHEKCQTLQHLQQVSKFTVQILPVIDIFNHLDIKRCMSAGQNCSIIDNILIPTDLVGTLALYNKSSDVRLRHEIFKSSYLYFMNSSSIRPSKFLGSENEVVVLSTFSPRLTYFITNLLLKSETSQNLSQINLGNFREVIKQHDNLSKIIWGNMNQLSQESYDYIHQEKEHVISIFKSMALQLSQLDDTHFGTSISKLYEELDNVETDISSTDCSLGKDCVAFYERFKGCILDYRQLLTVKDIDKTLLLISNLYMNVSTMKAIFNSQLSLIDPLAKKSLKKEYCLEAIKLFEDMKVCYELQNRIYSNCDTTVHEYHACLENMIWKLKKTNEKLDKYVAVRECEVLYESVIRVINHAFSTVLSEDYLTKTNSSLNDCIRYIIEAAAEMRDVNDKDCLDVLNKEESKIISYENLIYSWNRLRNSYPDIVEPLLCNVCEFVYGLKMKTSLLRKLLKSYKMRKYGINVNGPLIGLVRWPILNAEQNSYRQHIQELVNMSRNTFFESEAMKHEKFRLLKCAIQESFNHNVVNSIGTETLNKELFLEFSNLLNIVVNIWNKQEERKKIIQDEVDSLYKTKSKCDDKPEEEQIAEELTKLFPNYHSIDFADFEQSPDLPEEQPNIESKSSEIFTYEDIKSIMNLHSALLKNYTRTEWLNPDRKRNVHCDFIRPFVEKYKVFRRVFDEFLDSFDYTMDNKLIGSLSVLIATNKNQEDASQICDIVNTKNTDFYKDPNTEEVKSCYHILEELRLKINEFLREWPEQPTLKTIITAIDRINNFDINSPISRFLTGFEIVLNKCHEWEQVAHSGVSLSQFYQSLTEQIISWRKLELSMWKDLLNRTYDRLNEPMTKWWLYLYSIMHDFIVEKSHDETKLIELLQSFITASNLAEFQGRLELLYIFHCHATYFERSKESEMFINILWNVYNYFEQFSLTVANKVKDLRSPIEKKLKDYVKIVRWKDISYWAVKETVDKSHKILHKYMREFEDALQQPVSSCLHNIKNYSDSEMEGIWDRPQRQNPKSYHYTLDAESYMAKLSVTKKFQLINLEEGEGVFSKMESYFLKSRKLCKNTILATSYPNLIQCLDGLITDIISTSTHLQNFEVDTTLSKEKQKSRAKQILQQKHRALSVLFKNLSLIGLSFRTGIIKNKLKKSSEDFLLKPIDLTANFNHINNERSEEKILTMWNSCEFYYTRSLMRADVLETALQTPAKDLGMQNIERCKGFSAHLLDLAQKQKTELIESSRIYYYLRYYIKQINDAHDGKFFLSFETVNEILTLFQKTIVVLNQYKIILNTCPPEDGFCDQNIEIPILREGVKEVFYRNTRIWTNTTTLINEILTTVTKLSGILMKCKGSVPSIEYELFSPEFIPISDKTGLIDEIFNLSDNIRKLREIFGDIVLSDSLVWLEDEYQRIEYLCKIQVTDDNPNDSKDDVEEFMEQTLLVIQSLYKKYTSADKEQHKENEDESQLQHESPLQQDHLKTLLVENLSSDIALLEMKKILIRTDKVAQIVLTTPQDTTVKKMAYQCVPLLEQIVHLYQYFITQQVATYRIIVKMSSVLLNIFIELTSKGFCTPPEFSDDMDGEGISKPTDGLGLGEGQGERDVSDKIESEDQLEDAQPAGQEKEKDEDTDCKEEDKGIEMSEDFDSKLQDKDKKEGDDSDESSGDEDADEQMGDTEKGAEQLDQEIWGSDKEDEQEEDDGEEDTKNEERGDKGEKEGEEQLGAKDQNRSKDNDEEQDNETSEEREKTKKEINEMEEPEYDDEQMDIQHGKQPDLPEPEAMDLPEDLQLDEGQEHDNDDNQEENPFDIDTMKEQNEPNDTEQGEDVAEEDKKNDEERDFSSDDEEIAEGDQKDQEGTTQEHIDDKDKEDDRGDESTEIEKEEDKTKDTNEESTLDQTQSNQDNVEAMEVDKTEATDKVQTSQDIQKSTQPIDELCQEDRPDSQGVGQSQMEESSTGHSAQTSAPQDIKSSKTDVEEEMFKQKPGESDSKRSLGDVDEPVRKKLKTIDLKQSMSETQLEEDQRAEEEQSEMYQHIHEGEKSKTQVLDVATDEQVQTQKKTIPSEEDEEIEDSSEPSKDLPEDDECKDIEKENVVVEKPNKTEGSKESNSKKKQHPEGDILEEIQDIDVEGEVIETLTVPRTTDSSHHTLYTDISNISVTRLTSEETNNLRLEVEKQLSSWNEPPATHEADQTWQKISSVTSALSQDLSEQLRLVLEPTQASRLKGDYRTGRRINMRKVIPYIASQFRKDKIWLRRSKPSKREYHIVIAIDDSSSMVDNHSKELAFESVALISKALTLLESGQLSVMSFGETTEIVHKLTDQFTDKSGAKLLQKFRFNQNKTCVAKLVDFVTEMFQQTHLQSNALNAKLLVVVSDGRGVFSEGETYVKQAVRRAKLANIFMVFVIIDNPDNKNSVLDIRMPVFKDGKLLGIQNYMDEFPFSFYIILRDINSLPSVLSDALRQWFEIVSNLE